LNRYGASRVDGSMGLVVFVEICKKMQKVLWKQGDYKGVLVI
jgi:hypothetical protein